MMGFLDETACTRCGAPTHDGGWCWRCRAAGRRECPDCGNPVEWRDGEGACPLNCHQPPGWFANDDVLRCPDHGSLPVQPPMSYDWVCPDCHAMNMDDHLWDDECPDYGERVRWNDWWKRLRWQVARNARAGIEALEEEALARLASDLLPSRWPNVAAQALEEARTANAGWPGKLERGT